ncbi:MAG: hypothetical protein ACYCOR_10805 [Acidobacteriaceae bacterium]
MAKWENRNGVLRPSPIAFGGVVRAIVSEPSGRIVSDETFHNTATNWSFYACASWYSNQAANNGGSVGGISPPGYIAVGTGAGLPAPSVTDTAMFMEQYNTRRAFTFVSNYQGYTAQMTLSYAATDPDGTYTDAGLYDSLPKTVALASNVAVGVTTLPLAAGAPAVQGGTIAGQYNTAYINDTVNPEYVSIATTAAAGATSWTIQSPTLYSHLAGVQIVAFTGNLFAHSAITVTKGYGQQLTIQWSVPFQAGTLS